MKPYYLQTHTYFFSFLALVVAGLLVLPSTALGFFSSVQTAPQQSFGAGTLTLTTPAPMPPNGTVTPATSVTSTVSIDTVAGSIPAVFSLSVQEATGGVTWCEELQIAAVGPGGEVVGTTPAAMFQTGQQSSFGEWALEFSTESAVQPMSGAVCAVTFSVDAWQEHMNPGVGFVDQDSFTVLVTYQYEASDDTPDGGSDNGNQNNGTSTVAGSIIINELNWAGSEASGVDQWIELYNPGSEPVDVSGWELLNAKAGNGTSTLPVDTIIAPGAYYLIARFDQGHENSALSEQVSVDFVDTISLANDYSGNGAVVLRTATGEIVDRTPEPTGSSWPHGNNQTGTDVQKWSMQRGENPGDGAGVNNWYTCVPSVLESDGTLSTMQSYWLDDYHTSSCGTPGHENLSSNDPTSEGYQPTVMRTTEKGGPASGVAESGVNKNRDEKEDSDLHDTHGVEDAASKDEKDKKEVNTLTTDQGEKEKKSGTKDLEKRKEEEEEKDGSDDAMPGNTATREEDVLREESEREDADQGETYQAADNGGDGNESDVEDGTDTEATESTESNTPAPVFDEGETGIDEMTITDTDSNAGLDDA